MSNVRLHIESPTDSVLQDRMKISHRHRVATEKPIALMVLIIGLIGGGWYLYAQSSSPTPVIEQVQQVAAVPENVTPPPTTPAAPTLTTTPVKPTTPKPESVPQPAPETPAPVLQTQAVVPTVAPKAVNKEELLARAKLQISRTRLTLPAGDNAYETYQALVKISPTDAAQILDAIAQWHYEQGTKFIKQDKLTSPSHGGNAYQFYEKMKELIPEHPDTQKLLDDILQGFEVRAKKQIKSNNVLSPEKNSAYATCKEMAQLAPDHKTVKSCLNQVANELLVKAKKQVADKLYMTPANNNALDTYQKILSLVPDHAQAQAGLKSLAREYYKLALKTKREKRLEISKDMTEKGLQINPQDSKLLELKKQLETAKH
ncbi:MAG: hypothetical protein R3E08_07020 [Thiotrichaceae bacterium]